MADQPGAVPHQVDFEQQLEQALSEPEPMCLAVVQLQVKDRKAESPQLVNAVEARLRDSLRDYDLLARIDDTRFAMVLRTLADANALSSRMHGLYSDISKPYTINRRNVKVPVLLGAAVRIPAETPVTLMKRASQALTAAEAAGGEEPVLI